jgi:NADPH:quinone reductase-like Zn-dependent oxidoreductase
MKAVMQRRYGKPAQALTIEEIDKPSIGADQVLVRVRASSINSIDCRHAYADPVMVRFSSGLRKPQNPRFGGDVAGVVEAAGADTTDLKPGDEVFGVRQRGGLAEYVAGTAFSRKPTNASMEEAAALPTAALTALQALRDQAQIKAGQHVVINGAGGGVGTFAVQIAKALGATVTAVTSTSKQQLMHDLGADQVLDYQHEDFTRERGRYDAVIDLAGDHSFRATRRALTPNGALVIVGAHRGVLRRYLFGSLRHKLLKHNIRFFIAEITKEDLETIRELTDAGKVRPVIDRTYPFEKAAAAVEYAATQQAAGKVVVTVSAT